MQLFWHVIQRSLRRSIAVSVSTVIVSMPCNALACIAVENWQQTPSLATIENSTGIYLGRFIFLQPAGENRISIFLEVVETMLGDKRDRVTVVVDQISAVHGARQLTKSDHSASRFWLGKESNTRLMPDCTYSPVEFFEDGLYMVLLAGDKLKSSVSFERIEDPDKDLWYQFVKCHLTNARNGNNSEAHTCALPPVETEKVPGLLN